MSLFSLCLTYTLICQTRLTAPDPGRISQQARQHTGRTIFSHPKSRHRPMQSSTLICLHSVSLSISPSLIFMSFPQLSLPPSLSLSLSLLLLPFISVLARPPSSHFCFITVVPLAVSPPLMSLFSFLPTGLKLFFPCACLSSFSSLSSVFPPGFHFLKTFLTSSHSLSNMPIKF